MIRWIGFSLLAAAAVAAVAVFGIWQPFVGWDYADVLPEARAELGGDRQVVAIEISEGTVAFVVEEGARVRVRHYFRHCVLKDGDAIVNGQRREGNCELRTRRSATFTRTATRADRVPTVPLRALAADVIERFEDDGMRSMDDPVFWRGRWRYDAPLTVSKSAAPDGTGIKPSEISWTDAQIAVRELVGAPPIGNL